jgi:hypothetical protein
LLRPHVLLLCCNSPSSSFKLFLFLQEFLIGKVLVKAEF